MEVIKVNFLGDLFPDLFEAEAVFKSDVKFFYVAVDLGGLTGLVSFGIFKLAKDGLQI